MPLQLLDKRWFYSGIDHKYSTSPGQICSTPVASRTPECFRFHPWNSSPAKWRCTPDRRRLYRMLWGKPPAEWYSSTKFGSHVSLFLIPIFGVNNRGSGDSLVISTCSCSWWPIPVGTVRSESRVESMGRPMLTKLQGLFRLSKIELWEGRKH
jgi:hypothetical protein